MLINIALLVTGLVVLLLYQYIGLFSSSMLPIIAEPRLTIVALISTYFFRKTGHIYAGAFLCAIFVTWYIVAWQATHFAF